MLFLAQRPSALELFFIFSSAVIQKEKPSWRREAGAKTKKKNLIFFRFFYCQTTKNRPGRERKDIQPSRAHSIGKSKEILLSVIGRRIV